LLDKKRRKRRYIKLFKELLTIYTQR